jgi:hypothetical protein
MAAIPVTGTIGGDNPCYCCCLPSGIYGCATDSDCAGNDPYTTCIGGCCVSNDLCGGCSPCEICVGSGEDVACAECPPLADFSACVGEDTTTHPECSGYDYDGSGTVDLLDFAYYRQYCQDCG